MRDDVKIGILLGFLVMLAAFIFWWFHQAGQDEKNGGMKDLTKQTDGGNASGSTTPVGRTTSGDSPAPRPAAGSSGTGSGTGSSAAPAVSPSDMAISDVPTIEIEKMRPTKWWVDDPERYVVTLTVTPPPSLGDITASSAVIPSDSPVLPPVRRPVGDEPAPPPSMSGPTAGRSTPSGDVPVGVEVSSDGTWLYRVQENDSPWMIAQRIYGNGMKWTLLKEANPGVSFSPLPSTATLIVPKPQPSTSGSTTAGASGSTSSTRVLAANQYEIKEGDVLGVIAQQKYGRSSYWTKIVEANPGLDPAKLQVGQVITLPDLPAAGSSGTTSSGTTSGTTGNSTSTSTPSDAPLPAGQYRIKEGDNLWNIAAEKLGNGAKWDKILEANPGLDENNLPVGKVINIPTTGSTSGDRSSRPGASTPPTGASDSPVAEPGRVSGSLL